MASSILCHQHHWGSYSMNDLEQVIFFLCLNSICKLEMVMSLSLLQRLVVREKLNHGCELVLYTNETGYSGVMLF